MFLGIHFSPFNHIPYSLIFVFYFEIPIPFSSHFHYGYFFQNSRVIPFSTALQIIDSFFSAFDLKSLESVSRCVVVGETVVYFNLAVAPI
jgi:hypothetical protein